MGFDLSETKRQARQALHSLAGVAALYTSPYEETSVTLYVRFHNKSARPVGDLENGGYAEILTGIDRLVFQESNLAAPLQPDGTTAAAVTLAAQGTVEFETYGLTFSLDVLEPPDGPENVYWTVVRTS